MHSGMYVCAQKSLLTSQTLTEDNWLINRLAARMNGLLACGVCMRVAVKLSTPRRQALKFEYFFLFYSFFFVTVYTQLLKHL